MPDKKLTDNEIKKALNVCVGMQNDCGDCPLLEYSKASDECMTELMSNALDLINRLQADSKRLKKVQMQLDDAMKMYRVIKAEAYKECIEKVLEKRWDVPYETKSVHYVQVVDVGDIEDTLKELVGEDNG